MTSISARSSQYTRSGARMPSERWVYASSAASSAAGGIGVVGAGGDPGELFEQQRPHQWGAAFLSLPVAVSYRSRIRLGPQRMIPQIKPFTEQ
jgi:hypothetical protein